jgi:hypothetical protein
MHGDGHVGGNVGHGSVDEIAVELGKLLRIVAAAHLRLAIVRVAQHGDEHLVELQIAAAGVGKGAHRLAISGSEIGEELVNC